MRTTVTLDEDVAAALKQAARDRGISFKEALNSSVRRGLAPAPRSAGRYRVPARSMGMRPGIDVTKALQLAGDLEDAEILRKLRRGV
jgi:hypothetical protein